MANGTLSSMPLDQFLRSAPPFTLLAFKGADLVSKLIRVVEKWNIGEATDFSHVGILITSECCPFVPNLRPGVCYSWESTWGYRVMGMGEGLPDVASGKCRFGVQIRELAQVVPLYTASGDAAVAMCALKHNPWLAQPGESTKDTARRRAKLIAAMQRVYKQFANAHYEFNLLELCAAGIPCLRKARDALHSSRVDGLLSVTNAGADNVDTGQFCSEFVAHVYKALGIIPDRFRADEVMPCDFFGKDTDGMPAIANAPIYLIP